MKLLLLIVSIFYEKANPMALLRVASVSKASTLTLPVTVLFNQKNLPLVYICDVSFFIWELSSLITSKFSHIVSFGAKYAAVAFSPFPLSFSFGHASVIR